ncbi:unnamed protein product [Rangifer tarandus platyrhynchus]|uniref:Uncharacterized protein n=2 Tax=Rangifer tarandus platyrhynchus TaxID=3082113 RepID=A0ABN8Y796_RANTA|nr:unnamed protein product [Rangifer tarandus platyrhynchus]
MSGGPTSTAPVPDDTPAKLPLMDTGPPARVGTPISPGLCSPLCPHTINCGAATHCGTCSRAGTRGVFTEQDSEVKADAEVEQPGGRSGEGSQGPQCVAALPRGPAGGAVGTPPSHRP